MWSHIKQIASRAMTVVISMVLSNLKRYQRQFNKVNITVFSLNKNILKWILIQYTIQNYKHCVPT